jgi:hypothetical protein
VGVGVGRGSLVVTEAQTEGGDTRGWHQGGYRFSGGGLVAGGGFSFRVGVRRGGGGGGGVFTDAVWCSDFPLERGRGITAAVEGGLGVPVTRRARRAATPPTPIPREVELVVLVGGEVVFSSTRRSTDLYQGRTRGW